MNESGTTDKMSLLPPLLTAPAKKLFYCPVEKVGSTFWRRMLFALNSSNNSAVRSPFNVSIDEALKWSKPRYMSLAVANDSIAFLFVRNPFSRLLSAFIDKLVSPNPIYWKLWGIPAAALAGRQVTSGHDVTFAEFVALVVNSEKTGKGADSHFTSITRICRPCTSNFTFIGRMESFKVDTLLLLRQLKLEPYAKALSNDFEMNTIDDIIVDTVTGPFEWRKDTVKFISWEKALMRIWLKLQMRGIISKRKELSLAGFNVETITREQFIDVARNAHEESSREDLGRQKDIVKQEAFSLVPIKYLDAFRDTFKKDFYLFNYDATPLFTTHNVNTKMIDLMFFNYTHLN